MTARDERAPRMPALVAAAAATAIAAMTAAGCGATPPQTELRVDIYNDPAGATPVPRPTTVLLSWLDAYGFLFRDRPFAVPAGSGRYLGDVVVRMYVADTGARRALARGQVAGQVVSEGWGTITPVAGEAGPPVEIDLAPVDAARDADGDTVPDPIDNCPGHPNPEQKNTDC